MLTDQPSFAPSCETAAAIGVPAGTSRKLMRCSGADDSAGELGPRGNAGAALGSAGRPSALPCSVGVPCGSTWTEL